MEKIKIETEREFLQIAHDGCEGYSSYKEEKLSNFDTEKGFVDVTFYVERESDGKKFKGEYTRGGQGNNWCDSLELEEIVPKVKKKISTILDNEVKVLDWEKVPKEIASKIDELFGDSRLNAWQMLYLEDWEDGNIGEVTQYMRDNGITANHILVDNTW